MPADLVADAAIRTTCTRYCQRCDDGDFSGWAELFAEDATFSVLGRTHEGREACRAFIEAAMPPERRGKHFLGQSEVDIDGDEATAVSDYLFIAKVDGGGYAITSAGRYHDRLVREADGEWRFKSREIVFL